MVCTFAFVVAEYLFPSAIHERVVELWQMEGRVERDIWYIQHWSLWLDLRIIWMTVKTIFKRDEKAY